MNVRFDIFTVLIMQVQIYVECNTMWIISLTNFNAQFFIQ